MNSVDFGDISSESKVKKLLLDHFYPHFEKNDLIEEIKTKYKGEIVVAKDLEVVEI